MYAWNWREEECKHGSGRGGGGCAVPMLQRKGTDLSYIEKAALLNSAMRTLSRCSSARILFTYSTNKHTCSLALGSISYRQLWELGGRKYRRVML